MTADLPPPETIRARDPEALGRVVHALLPQVLRTARGAGFDEVGSEEIAQETFRTFVETAERFEGRSSVRTWVFGILYRKIHEARRSQGRERRFDPLEDEEIFETAFHADGSWATPPRSPSGDLSRKELRQEISRCLEASPTVQKMAFLLREVEGLTTDEICDILGVTRSNLGVMLHRLRHRTRSCLEAKGVGL